VKTDYLCKVEVFTAVGVVSFWRMTLVMKTR